eukprot:TRINITY_DN8669_c0_g1_i4.p1 TRINITY_DN8669_c0_g1~~TRINITY_DN8669_c0_g1_i4.p1  ORF type:complete len:383 (+),score=30.78 TRINITY_DN8669_c0_g1_i4:33-1151(+)
MFREAQQALTSRWAIFPTSSRHSFTERKSYSLKSQVVCVAGLNLSRAKSPGLMHRNPFRLASICTLSPQALHSPFRTSLIPLKPAEPCNRHIHFGGEKLRGTLKAIHATSSARHIIRVQKRDRGRLTAVSPVSALSMSQDVAATSLQVALVKDGQVEECSLSAADFLSSAQRGAYTTARTVNRTSVFEFEFHVARLVESATLMMASESSKPDLSSEPFACLTATLELSIHLSPLPARPSPPVKVELRGHARSNAAAKDSEWVRQRKSLEDSKPSDVNEIVLMGDDGSVLEGMSSNFFVVRGGAVMTAQEGVLLGTVREVALQVCKKLPGGVEVVLEAPNVRDIGAWEGVFISSTSRLVLPVDELRYTGPEVR